MKISRSAQANSTDPVHQRIKDESKSNKSRDNKWRFLCKQTQ